jgi:hypothetical protein
MTKRNNSVVAAIAPFVVVLVYLSAAAVVFDFSKAAYPSDEDYYDGRKVAIGPRPRSIFCPPTVEGVRWEGREWPFVVFAPVCSWWRERHGYAPSHAWR